MSTYSQIESWIPQTALAAGGTNRPDAEGFWRLPYGRITLSLGVPEQSDSFILYAPLMSVTGASHAALASFYQYLLQLQLQGSLPAGMAFGMDMGDTLVGIVGQYAVSGMDLHSFDRLLRDAASAADALSEQLQSRFAEMLDDDIPAVPSEKLPQSRSTEAPLSDEELLRARMMQSMSF